MCEIKLRYYIKECKDFVYFIQGLYYFKGEVGSYVFDWEKADQYTGIQDKNRNEVYGGDWIKTKTGYIDFVRWSDDYAGFFPFFVSGINESDFEIIGNIYENPELLKREVV